MNKDLKNDVRKRKKTICISCSILKGELNLLIKNHFNTLDVIYIESMLHMRPKQLATKVLKELDENQDKNIILIYGDCFLEINNLRKNNVFRLNGTNCCNILLDKKYKKLRREGAFILINEWLNRWEEVFKNELGFKKSETAQLFMQEMHTKLVYLDTGIVKVPHQTLLKISDYCGLPYSVESCKLNHLQKGIQEALNYFENENR